MKSFLKACLVGVVFSMYIFPFEFYALPEINTKMMIAVVGLALFGLNLIAKRTSDIGKDMFGVTVFAMLFSLVSYLSVVYNNTTDMAYATYFISMWVWVGAAYCIIELIRKVHGRTSLQLIFHYFAWVCVIQLCLALIIDSVPSFQNIVDTYISQNKEYLHETKRLYGIGAAFDTAGIRFSCALLGLSYLITHKPSSYWLWFYWIMFVFIVIVGNMMSRTTIIGVVLSLIYMLVYRFKLNPYLSKRRLQSAFIWLAGLSLLVAFLVSKYNQSADFQHDLRYAFEGFFNYVESGEWETSSTNRLKTMLRWPDNFKTWIIGDGWFDNPDDPGSFYKYTDIGYLRLIYYSGLIGLISFISMFFFVVIRLCIKWPNEKLLFVFYIFLQFLVWIKISTDIFQIFALMLLLAPAENCCLSKIFVENDTQEDSSLLA